MASVSQHSADIMSKAHLAVFLLALLVGPTSLAGAASYVIGPDKPATTSTCTLCHIGVTAFLAVYRLSANADLRGLAIGLCLQLNVQPEHVCEGLIDQNLAVLRYILDNSEDRDFTPVHICSTVFQEHHCGDPDPQLDWSVDLGGETAPPLQPWNTSKSDPITVVQLTDIHFDPDYAPGSNADCGEPVCCHANQRTAKSADSHAGRWGDYRGCDTSWDALLDTFKQVKTQHKKIDYIYMTGDLVDHRVHATSVASNNETFYKVMQEMKTTFQDIPIFPCLGNHESHPVNVYAPTSITDVTVSTNWLYETMADVWSMWLPDSTRGTILKGGYYTVLVRPGFRVISLNNNNCNTYNWWLLYGNNADTDGQLTWLVQVLRQAESAHEKVHILYHIPSGSSDCYRVWSREFNRIVERFANTITAQFSGHTHYDQFQVYYSAADPTKAINVLFNGGSVTAFKDVNPNYKVYSVDAENMDVLDSETWIYNLTAANLVENKSPEWSKMYSFRDAYKIESMSPAELDKLAHRMATDDQLLHQYFEYYNLRGDPELRKGCNRDCQESLLCGMVSARSSNFTQCDRIVTEFRAAH